LLLQYHYVATDVNTASLHLLMDLLTPILQSCSNL